MNDSHVREESSLESLVGRVADEFLTRQNQGERPSVEEYVARHPEAADMLRNVLASLEMIDQSGAGALPGMGPEFVTGTLGDFRLLREVGRGGMGIVYEAEQISLGRRVALKVLPFAATMDPRRLQRFQNEARSAASLRHDNIVQVFAVGQERGIHYFAMQFIDGITLADVVAQQKAAEMQTLKSPSPSGGEETCPIAAAQTQPTPNGAAYHRRVAEWGIHAAEALEHAHSFGIVHRDIKPANLMIDGQGKLWVTDFGLARVGEGDLTLTGDLVGTLRYMSPEQALAKHGLVDVRTDVYSLGITLYELLTRCPVIAETNRQEILLQIASEEPRLLRSLDPNISVDLETIILKAIRKSPGDRYTSARELAEDLARWLGGEPILARRPSLGEKIARWANRRRGLVAAGILLLFLTAAGFAISTAIVAAEQHKTAREAEEKESALKQVQQQRDLARDTLRKAVGLCESQTLWAEHLAKSGKADQARQAYLRLWEVLTASISQLPEEQTLLSNQLLVLASPIADGLESIHEYAEAARFAEQALQASERYVAAIPLTDKSRNLEIVMQRDAFDRWSRVLLLGGRYQEAANAAEVFRQYLLKHEPIFRQEEDWTTYFIAYMMRVELQLATIHAETDHFTEAKACYQCAIRHLDREENAQGTVACELEHARALVGLGELRLQNGRPEEARQEFLKARQLLGRFPRLPETRPLRKAFVWLLATCPDPQIRDSHWAEKELAEWKSKDTVPDMLSIQGVVYLRTGKSQKALETLVRRVNAFDKGTAADWFHLSIAHALNGDTATAQDWYDKATRWASQRRPNEPALRRLNAEAAALLKSKQTQSLREPSRKQ